MGCAVSTRASQERAPADPVPPKPVKAISKGANACSGGRLYLYALAAGGQKGVEKAMTNLRNEIERDMKLMGVKNIDQLSRKNLRFR